MKMNPYLEIVIAAIIWGSSGLFVKLADLPSTTLGFFRTGIPAILLLVYFLIKKESFKKDESKLFLLFVSLLFALKTLVVILGFQYAPLNIAIIALYTWPLFGALFSYIFLKEKMGLKNKVLLFVAFLGVIFIFFNQEISLSNKVFLGTIFMIIAAVFHALVVVLLKKQKKLSKYKTVFYQNLIGAILFLPFLFINNVSMSLFQFGTAFSYGLFTGLIGFIIFFAALRKIKTTTGLQLTYIEVVSAIIFGIIFFKEALSWNIIVGGFLIIGSSYFLKK